MGLTSLFLLWTTHSFSRNEAQKPDGQPQKVEASLNETNQLALRVLYLANDLFPTPYRHCPDARSGAICIGKFAGAKRYAGIFARTGNQESNIGDHLEITVYTDLDAKLESYVNNHLSRKDYASAEDALWEARYSIESVLGDKSKHPNLRALHFCDGDADGFLGEQFIANWITSIKHDEVIKVNIQELAECNPSYLERANQAYTAVLRIIEPYLKEELKPEEKREKLEAVQMSKEQRKILTMLDDITVFGF